MQMLFFHNLLYIALFAFLLSCQALLDFVFCLINSEGQLRNVSRISVDIYFFYS